MESFKELRPSKEHLIHHIDNNLDNNFIDNLEWKTKQEIQKINNNEEKLFIDEIWKNVIYEDFDSYKVSNYSRIKNSRGQIIRDNKERITMYSSGKKISKQCYHISIETFVQLKPGNGFTVDHIDKNHNNNHISNLRWATALIQSLNKNPFTCIGHELVYIKNDIRTYYKSITEFAKNFNVSRDELYKDFENSISIIYDMGELIKIKLLPNDNEIDYIPNWICKSECKFDNKYKVSKSGLIYLSNIWKKGGIHKNKYFTVSINKKNYLVHILIAATFLGKPPQDGKIYIVNHKDNNGFNNNIENLEYATHKENTDHAVALGLCGNKKILQYSLDGIFIKEYFSIHEAARDYDVDPSSISQCCYGKNGFKSMINYQWKFKETDIITQQIEPFISKKFKSIIQYTVSGNFVKSYYSLKDAGIAIGQDPTSIGIVCSGKGRSKTAFGFQWKYKESENIPDKIDSIEQIEYLQLDKENNVIKKYSTKKEILDIYDMSRKTLDKYVKTEKFNEKFNCKFIISKN